ncbi:hypothetical protein N7E70_020550 [Aminobacter sp. NyZ550]|uniref:hypothetical protein n=1 Tax=Aminobacter sp. NyZ550 TaxID=2979870 RepID=UPI0021D596A3|nr:hypothetical protein [Aminobacter sp. NyZ550]WAX94051.1 hypothetical protein N7E70_020550 [Aminobacter sp. NyZ550]
MMAARRERQLEQVEQRTTSPFYDSEWLRAEAAGSVLAKLWSRPVLKRDAMGIHGTLFYDNEHRRDHLPLLKREVDWDDGSVNQAQRALFARHR